MVLGGRTRNDGQVGPGDSHAAGGHRPVDAGGGRVSLAGGGNPTHERRLQDPGAEYGRTAPQPGTGERNEPAVDLAQGPEAQGVTGGRPGRKGATAERRGHGQPCQPADDPGPRRLQPQDGRVAGDRQPVADPVRRAAEGPPTRERRAAEAVQGHPRRLSAVEVPARNQARRAGTVGYHHGAEEPRDRGRTRQLRPALRHLRGLQEGARRGGPGSHLQGPPRSRSAGCRVGFAPGHRRPDEMGDAEP